MKYKCDNCYKEIDRFPSHFAKYKHAFCCSSCAATYNNKIAVKRQLSRECKHCGTLTYSNLTYCKKCISQGIHIHGTLIDSSMTKAEAMKGLHGSNRYRRIRSHAKSVVLNRDQKCFCGYDKHVEVCHKKPIADFLPTDTLAVINADANLILMCPNHHWEFDNL